MLTFFSFDIAIFECRIQICNPFFSVAISFGDIGENRKKYPKNTKQLK